jgi:hypothetical protein
MLRCLILALSSISLSAALLPEQFAEFKRESVSSAVIADRPVWDEFGLAESEGATFSAGGRKITVTAYRMKDPTGAFAAFQWQRPSNAASGVSSASFPGGILVVHANYLIDIAGKVHPSEQEALYDKLPRLVRSSLPTLSGYLPGKGLVPNSERYVLGPASLARFEPRISSPLAAFEMGAEGQIARYRTGSGDVQLSVFSYPTPQIASARLQEFGKLPDAFARRSGPLVAVAFPKSADANSLIERVSYEPRVSWTEQPAPAQKNTAQDAAQMILAILILAGVLIAASVLLGMIFGGFRIALGRFGIETAHNSLTTLNIDRK